MYPAVVGGWKFRDCNEAVLIFIEMKHRHLYTHPSNTEIPLPFCYPMNQGLRRQAKRVSEFDFEYSQGGAVSATVLLSLSMYAGKSHGLVFLG